MFYCSAHFPQEIRPCALMRRGNGGQYSLNEALFPGLAGIGCLGIGPHERIPIKGINLCVYI